MGSYEPIRKFPWCFIRYVGVLILALVLKRWKKKKTKRMVANSTTTLLTLTNDTILYNPESYMFVVDVTYSEKKYIN